MANHVVTLIQSLVVTHPALGRPNVDCDCNHIQMLLYRPLPDLCWLETDSPLPLARGGGADSFVIANKEIADIAVQGEKRKWSLYHH